MQVLTLCLPNIKALKPSFTLRPARPVSYTHLDVYKRQFNGSDGSSVCLYISFPYSDNLTICLYGYLE